MLKITCEIPNDEKNLAFRNIVKLSKTKNYSMIFQCCLAWLIENNEINLQNLEKLLRNNNLDVFLIASDKINDNEIISLPNCDRELKYNCIISCKDKNEVLKYSNSYEENFTKLLNTGFTINKDDSFKNILDKTKDLDGLQFRLMHNKVRIELENVDPRTELQKDIKYALEKFGVKPVPVVIAKNNTTNEDIYGLVVHIGDKQDIISQYGYIKKENELKYILVNDQSTW